MDHRARKARPNPFYVILVLASTAFMITSFGFLIGPFVERQVQERGQADPATRALAAWFDHHGIAALTVEFAVMFATGLLAMATDRWFQGRRKVPPPVAAITPEN